MSVGLSVGICRESMISQKVSDKTQHESNSHLGRRELRGREGSHRLGGRAGSHDLLGTRRTGRGRGRKERHDGYRGRGHAGDRLGVRHRSRRGGERRTFRADGRHVGRHGSRGNRHGGDGALRRQVGRLGRGRLREPAQSPAQLTRRLVRRRRLRRAVEPLARVAAAERARDGVARRSLGVALVLGIRRVGRRAPDESRGRADEGDCLDGRDDLQR